MLLTFNFNEIMLIRRVFETKESGIKMLCSIPQSEILIIKK